VTAKSSIKETLKEFMLKKDLLVTGATDPSLLEQFFRAIKPTSTNHPLIRIGGDSDGGYLVPDDLAGIASCFSPGVSEIADFEFQLAKRGIPCFLADYSIDQPPVSHSLFHFEKRFLGSSEDAMFMRLESWVARNAPPQGDLLLQMDIEGGEYGVILDTDREILRRFRILVIEFHWLDALFHRVGFELISLTFKKLLDDFEIVHIHPNNFSRGLKYRRFEVPSFMEFIFLRKDRISTRSPVTTFPHPLDRACVPGNDDFPLPGCWFIHL
jgi:hypothetical protein